jgi:hypothetical protein
MRESNPRRIKDRRPSRVTSELLRANQLSARNSRATREWYIFGRRKFDVKGTVGKLSASGNVNGPESTTNKNAFCGCRGHFFLTTPIGFFLISPCQFLRCVSIEH